MTNDGSNHIRGSSDNMRRIRGDMGNEAKVNEHKDNSIADT